MGNDQPRLVLPAGVDHAVGFVQAQTHRFFAEHGFRAGIRSGDGLLGVDLRVGAYADEIDFALVPEEVLVGRVSTRNVRIGRRLYSGSPG